MIEFLEKEGIRVCNSIANYSKKWTQPINLSKTVAQVFHSQVQTPAVNVYMENHKVELVKGFKYLGFLWTSKMSLKPTIDKALENIQRTYIKLKWMKGGRTLSKEVLRKCFFAYSFLYFSWIFPLYPFLPRTQKELFQRKFRKEVRLIHCCPFARATDLYQITKEEALEEYVKRYIKKRFKRIDKSDLGRSFFYNDIFYWDIFHKSKCDQLGHFFRIKRVRLLSERRDTLLLRWLDFLST